MSFKTIVVHVDNSPLAPTRIAVAAELARRHGAHLVGVAATGWLELPGTGLPGTGLAEYAAAALQALRDEARAGMAAFREQMARLDVASHEERIEEGHASRALVVAARHADLCVLSQADPDDALQSPLPAEDVLLQSGRPLLLLPYAGAQAAVPGGRRVLVGWNDSREAARALHDALPLLRAAERVDVAVFETPQDADRPLPGADVGLWLARHGVQVEVRHVPVKAGAGEALLSLAADCEADLVVAGGYGHSRWREAALGGVTRTLMRSAPVPVLLSH